MRAIPSSLTDPEGVFMPWKKQKVRHDGPVDSPPAGQDFEKLGVFYLGRRYDPAARLLQEDLLLYDSKDLVTHAVCVGMTGSGKTGLCIGLLEEAAIDGIPALIVDPKGDLTNLMLTFPELKTDQFAPWVNEEDARKKGLSAQDYAAEQADLWRKGLADWGQSGARIQKLRDAAGCVIYTPGSNAGIPVSILKSFAAPLKEILDEPELLHERIGTTVTGLLALIGTDADPIKSPEHILLSLILEQAWKERRDLDLASLIHAIQSPPVTRVGVMDVESFFPSKDRFALAMRLNNLLAAPGFGAWLQGEALDIDALLYTGEGKPRLAILSIAHLGDAERMFFVTLLLTQVVGWMRAQSGTTSLRAILYMDEIFGYFPPVANPPSKAPLLTLLKQARAFGLGVVVATQNPVDLDYKGLANAGTWFIGRLQTERDKARVLEGLEGAAATGGQQFDRGKMEQVLAGLGSRVFLMNNVHEDAPEIFQTRWTLSYLRGPLTRAQIKTLMEPVKHETEPSDVRAAASHLTPHATGLMPHSSQPVLPPEVLQHFIPIRNTKPDGTILMYRPIVLGAAELRFVDRKLAVDSVQSLMAAAPISDGAVAVDWDQAVELSVPLSDLEKSPADGAQFSALPGSAGKAKSYDTWAKEFTGWIYRSRVLEIFVSPSTKQLSNPGESERDFRVRLQQAGRERRDQAAERLRLKYASKIAALQERLRRAQQMVERQAAESRNTRIQAAISVGATILGAFLGRKTASAGNIGRATTAIRGAGRVMKETKDVAQAEENVTALQQQLADLETQFEREVQNVTAAIDPLVERLDTARIKPTKSNIAVKLFGLAWIPYWRYEDGRLLPAWE
jgi:hypothetical protein